MKNLELGNQHFRHRTVQREKQQQQQ